MYPVLFKIDPLTIYSLGLLWALGALAAVWILRLELKRHGYDLEIAGSVVFAAAIAGLLGARLLFILEEWENFTQAPFEFLFSGAGFSWYGGLIAGAVAAASVFKKHKLPFAQAADMAAPALALGYGIGRIGCFLAGDATWGKVTDVPWAMAFPNAVAGWVDPLTGVPYPPGVKVHPTQLYELIQSLFVFAILWALRKRNHGPGTIFYLYLVLAGLMRFIVEFWRANPIVGLGMTEYQWISLALVILGAGLLLYHTKLIKEEKGMAKDPVCGMDVEEYPSLRFSVRLPRDHYVRVDGNDYSINPRFIGRRVDVRVTLTEVVATCVGIEAARHQRCLTAHQTLTLPEHGQIARTMRIEQTVTDLFAAALVEQRDLAVYDRAIGLR